MDALSQTLRPLLQPITHNLPSPLVQTGESILGAQCYNSLIHNINLADTDCLKLAISKALGIGIIGASSIVKIPQLLKLLNSQSAEGISFLSYLLETSSYLISLMYNIRNQFPFSTYGEVALIVIQNVAISVLVLQYSGKSAAAAAFVAGLAGAGYALYSDAITPASTLHYLQAGAGVLGVASKLPQIITIFRVCVIESTDLDSLGFYASICTHTNASPRSGRKYRPTFCLRCLQLLGRLSLTHLHHPAGSSRQAHPLRLHRRLRPQRRLGRADGVLLEQSQGKSMS
jgi:uncharacterized protein with PQ loop repeat